MDIQTNTATQSVIQAAWKRRQTAYATYTALPADNGPVIDGHGLGEKALMDEINAAEEIIRTSVARTPGDVKLQLWCGLYHAFSLAKDHETLTRGDFSTLLIENEDLEWLPLLMLSALRSLEAMEAAATSVPSLILALHSRWEANNVEYELIDSHDLARDDMSGHGKRERAMNASQREEEALRAAILTQVPDSHADALVLMFHTRIEQDLQANSSDAAKPSDDARAILIMAVDTVFDFMACEFMVDHETTGVRFQKSCNDVFDARRYRTGEMEA